mgnify:CR=1 FL=1
MSFFVSIQTRLVSLLVGFLFLCTAALGAVLLGTQRLLAWLDGQHPQLTSALQLCTRWLKRHPKTISATLASVLLAGGGGAFAIANLGPDIAEQPVVTVTVPVEIAKLEEQAQSLDLIQMSLMRTDSTRASDTPESLLRRLGLVDPEAASYLRKNPLAKQALKQGGRSVVAEADAEQLGLRSDHRSRRGRPRPHGRHRHP